MLVYEVRPEDAGQGFEYRSEEEAKSVAQTYDRALLITWSVERNLPYAKPDFVYRSCSLMVWESIERRWRYVNIH
jgi:hypothetical protein